MMGVTEDRHRRVIRDKNRLEAVISRQLEIERILRESTDDVVALYTEKRNLAVERENLERNLKRNKKINIINN